MWSDLDPWAKARYMLEEEGTQNDDKIEVSCSTHLVVRQLLFHVTQQRGTLTIYSQPHALDYVKCERPGSLM